jgi:hypothetical protein
LHQEVSHSATQQWRSQHQSKRFGPKNMDLRKCGGTVTIFSGSGTDFRHVPVPYLDQKYMSF